MANGQISQKGRDAVVVSLGPSLAARHRGLIAHVARKDKEAFAELFGFFGGRLNCYFLRLGLDDKISEDLTQDVMLAIWRKAGEYEPEQSSVMAWIFSIARNRRIDILRRKLPSNLKADDLFGGAGDDITPFRGPEPSWGGGAIREALAALPDEQMAVVTLSVSDGKSHRMIANELDIPLAAVKSHLRLAFHHLRHELGDIL